MAQYDPTPAPGRFAYQAGKSWEEANAEAEADLQKYMDVSDNLPDGEVVGAVLTFPVADGQAVYRVTQRNPLVIQHIPFCDGYQIDAAHIRGLRIIDVLHQLKRRKAMNKLFGTRKKS